MLDEKTRSEFEAAIALSSFGAACDRFGVAVSELADTLARMFTPFAETIITIVKPVCDQFFLENGEWWNVDPRDLSSEDRWRYQKLVWQHILTTPARIWQRLFKGE